MSIRRWMSALALSLTASSARTQTPPASQPAPIRASIVINDLLVGGAPLRNEGTLRQAVRFGSADDITAFGIKPGSPAAHPGAWGRNPALPAME